MVKTSAQTKHSLMPYFKGMVMERDVGRKMSANHALRIKRKYKNISKMAKTLAVSRGKVYRDISMLSGTATFRKRQGIPTMDESNPRFLLQRRHKHSCTRENSVGCFQATQGKVSSEHDS